MNDLYGWFYVGVETKEEALEITRKERAGETILGAKRLENVGHVGKGDFRPFPVGQHWDNLISAGLGAQERREETLAGNIQAVPVAPHGTGAAPSYPPQPRVAKGTEEFKTRLNQIQQWRTHNDLSQWRIHQRINYNPQLTGTAAWKNWNEMLNYMGQHPHASVQEVIEMTDFGWEHLRHVLAWGYIELVPV
jgi:hypothetical protein